MAADPGHCLAPPAWKMTSAAGDALPLLACGLRSRHPLVRARAPREHLLVQWQLHSAGILEFAAHSRSCHRCCPGSGPPAQVHSSGSLGLSARLLTAVLPLADLQATGKPVHRQPDLTQCQVRSRNCSCQRLLKDSCMVAGLPAGARHPVKLPTEAPAILGQGSPVLAILTECHARAEQAVQITTLPSELSAEPDLGLRAL